MTEQAKVWRSPVLTNLEVLHATYRTHTFPRHVHEEFCIGIIISGVEAVKYRGETHIAPTGSIVVLQPDEGHSNWAAVDAGWSFKVIYPPTYLFQPWFNRNDQQPLSVPFFANPVIRDRPLFQQLAQFHCRLEQSTMSDRMELETRLLTILQTLVARHAIDKAANKHTDKPDHQLVQKIKRYLHTYYCQNLTLEDLSNFCDRSPFHLNRIFRESVGLPPHAYLTHIRIAHAKSRLSQSSSLAQLAVELGFNDQSHFTKTFKAWVGVTPGQYRAQLKAEL
ncbi:MULTISPECIES: AraC family transcriptional regulator [unclassified Leptolyngbya]|uniref:AraC family transcriptional regulator n=1 Tax=unclassified Leptolyngbya TaxID=2650499 RepID=UPI0016899223|nr:MULTISPECIES: AraC family transcriptional regulator [unclassified Leptolyngbya]MBD1909085.1 AraC family transcriptional regulator [Leptolyngbya sp. FACHB-8]MBD2157004.1 AraC family transcriptional regulator [Leptolyngbya sp. FACHB-16]